jgi:hypothetical protein
MLVSIAVIVDVLTSGRGERLPDDRRPLPATSIPSGEVVRTVSENSVPFGVLKVLASY